ncbi:hypothetical protein [Desulfotignum balticum]|jgi:hypothetical protein|uniref:hypothetical protein n=1 Tax=Desulfotignum balticum TaxID=115781 RepID=UPI0004628B59|nr:hypothetical protein [Desulfotignum balticum]
MNDSKNNFWFPKKKYGIGWGLPITWQGWVVLLMYTFLAIMGFSLFSNTPFQIPLFLVYFAVLTLVFIVIVWKKGEKINI